MGASMYEQYTGEFPIFFDRKGGGVVAGRASGTVQVLDAMTYSERSAQLSVEFVIADDDLIEANPFDNLQKFQEVASRGGLPADKNATLQKYLEGLSRRSLPADKNANELKAFDYDGIPKEMFDESDLEKIAKARGISAELAKGRAGLEQLTTSMTHLSCEVR